ncbi:MAG: hypothetical protein WAM60_09100 [Candidatus Promineifilaceae bacterium]
MNKLYSLFEDQEEAGKAVEVLAAAGFEDAEIHEIEDRSELQPEPIVVAPIHRGGYGAATPIPFGAFVSEIGNSEVEEFLKRNLKSGGVVVVVGLSDKETRDRVKRLLEEQGGQVV